jgi:hypothetical protein
LEFEQSDRDAELGRDFEAVFWGQWQGSADSVSKCLGPKIQALEDKTITTRKECRPAFPTQSIRSGEIGGETRKAESWPNWGTKMWGNYLGKGKRKEWGGDLEKRRQK